MIRQGEGRGGGQEKKQEARVSWFERQRRSREEKGREGGESALTDGLGGVFLLVRHGA